MKKGGDFEAMVDGWLAATGHRHTVMRVEPPVRVIKFLGNGRFEGCFASSGALDFAGSLGGHHVEFDVKDVKGRLSFDGKTVSAACLNRLRDLALDGARSGIVVRFREKNVNDDRIFAVSTEWLLRDLLPKQRSFTAAVAMGAILTGHDVTEIGYGPLAAQALLLWMSRKPLTG